jgi:WD40 repeat protein
MSCVGPMSSAWRLPTIIRVAPVVCLVLLAAGQASVAQEKRAAEASKAASEPAKPPSSSAGPVRTDLYGDPIPAGAAVRLGTVRFRGDAEDRHLAFSPDGNSLISAGYDKVHACEARSGKPLWESAPDGRSIEAFALSPDGKTAALFGPRLDAERKDIFASMTLLDVATGREQARIDRHRSRGGGGLAAQFTPDGTMLIAAGGDGTMTVWDLGTRQEILQFKMPGGGAECLDISPDGKLVAATGRDGVYLWPWTGGEKPVKLALKTRRAMAVQFSPDGKLLAIGDVGPIAVYLWDLQSAGVVRELEDEAQEFFVVAMAFTPDGKTLATPSGRGNLATPPGRREKAILLWDTTSGKVVRRLDAAPMDPGRLAISRDGRWLAATDLVLRRKKVWDLATGEELGRQFIGHEGTVSGVRFSPDGRSIITASDDGTVRVWNPTTGQQQRVLRHNKWVRGVAVAPDGKWIASNSLDNTVRLWDMATGKEVYRLPGHGRMGGHRPVAFTPDSRRFYSWGDDDAYLRVWDVATGKAIREFAICPTDVKPAEKDRKPGRRADPFERWTMMSQDAVFAPEGKLFALDYGRAVYLFDVETGQEIRKVSMEVGMRPFAISRDGKHLAVAVSGAEPTRTPLASGGFINEYPNESSLVLLDLASGKETWRQPLTGRSSRQLSFSPDGKHLLVGMNMDPPSSQIRILEAATGKTLHTIENVPSIGWRDSLVLSPEGKRLACAVNSTVLVWDLSKMPR